MVRDCCRRQRGRVARLQILQAAGRVRRGTGNPLVPIVLRHQNFPRTALGTALPGEVRFRPYPDPEEKDDAVEKLLARERVPAHRELELSYAGGAEELCVEVVVRLRSLRQARGRATARPSSARAGGAALPHALRERQAVLPAPRPQLTAGLRLSV